MVAAMEYLQGADGEQRAAIDDLPGAAAAGALARAFSLSLSPAAAV